MTLVATAKSRFLLAGGIGLLLLLGPTCVCAADVSWVLDGNGSWQAPVNWSSNPALPGPTDEVTLDVGGSSLRVITHENSDDTIAKLTSLEVLQLDGGSLTVTEAVNLASRSALRAKGAGVAFTALGSVTLNETSLFVEQGARISLPGATTFAAPANGSFEAFGTGTLIDLSGVTSFAGGDGGAMRLYATNGKLDLSSVSQIIGGATDLLASAKNAVIDLSALTSFTHSGGSASRLWAVGGATVLTPNLAQLSNVDVRLDGADSHMDLGKVTNVDRARVSAVSGAQISLPLVTSFADSSADKGLLRAEGAGSSLDLANVTSFVGGVRSTQVYANGGGKIDLSSVPQIPSGAVDLRASGLGSVLDLSELTAFTATGGPNAWEASFLWAQAGGKVLSPKLATLADVEVRVEGAGSSIDLNQLTSADRLRISVTDGALLALPQVTSYTGPTAYNGRFEAMGSAALLDLSTITSFAGGNGRSSQVFASQGGKVDLRNVPEFNAGAINLRASGSGSVVDLSSLKSWTHTGADASELWVQEGGKVVSPNLTSIVDVTIRVSGVTSQVDLDKLANVDRTRISATNGGLVVLPLVTAYAGSSGYRGGFESSNAGSLIDLSSITAFSGGYDESTELVASGGGKLDLRQVPEFAGGIVELRLDGPTTVVDLSALTSWTSTGEERSRLALQNGAKLLAPNLSSLVDVRVQVTDANSQLDLSKVANVDRATISVREGAHVALPLVTSYSGPSAYNGLFEATGTGSLVDLSTFTSFTGGDGRPAQVFATFGGKVDLKNLPAINGGASELRSTNAGSVLDISSLTDWTHTGGDQSRWSTTNGGTTLISPAGIELSGVALLVNGGGKLQGGAVTLAAGSSLETADGFGVDLVNNSGLVSVPNLASEMVFGANFTQADAGHTRIRLRNSGEDDTIEIAGEAKLAGWLEVTVLNDHREVALGDTIPVLTADSRTGNFEYGGAVINQSATFLLPVGIGNEVMLWAVLGGDANLDGQVDLNDFGLLKDNFGTGERLSEGNVDGEATVDLTDFGILKANFGRQGGPKLGDLAPTAVPEPATALLLAIGLLGLAARRRKGGSIRE